VYGKDLDDAMSGAGGNNAGREPISALELRVWTEIHKLAIMFVCGGFYLIMSMFLRNG